MSTIAELSRSRELMVNLTLRELRSKYKRSVLGWAWSLVNPLATMAIFTVVFKLFLKVKEPTGDPSGLKVFPLFLLCGLLPWNFLANSMTGAMGTLVYNGNLVKKVYFPRETLVASNVASWLVSFVIELGVLVVALVIVGNLGWPMLGLAVLVGVQAAFVVGVSLVLGILNVYFRDVQHFVGILLQLWFYASPIVYPASLVPVHRQVLGHRIPMRALYNLNPMTRFINAYRNCLYDVRMPNLGDVAYLVVVAALALGVGMLVFSHLEPRLAEEL